VDGASVRDDRRLHLVRGMRVTVREDASAFAYSILITATFGAANLAAGPVTVRRLFLFVLGATGAFAVAEAAVSRLFRLRIREEPGDVIVLGSALAPISVGAALAVAVGVLQLSATPAGWILAPFLATLSYVTLAGLQMAFAHRYERRHPPADDEEGTTGSG
jgi:hypothetical protein